MDIEFTIIVAVFNEEAFIGACLSSIIKQEYDADRYEIIIVDGLSTDRTKEIALTFKEQFKNLIVLDNPRRTVPYALNIALKHAHGRIILRVDGHASIEKDYLRQCAYYLDKTGAECVGGAIQSINHTFLGRVIASAMSSRFGVGNARFRTSGKAGYVDCLAFGAYRKEIFERIGGFDESFTRCQDDEFNYRLRGAGGKIYFTPEIRAYYYPRDSLRLLWRQYFQYGYYKVRVLQRHFLRMQWRQFVPPAFVFSLIFAIVLAALASWGWKLLAAIILPYLLLSFSSSLLIAAKKGIGYLLLLPLVFLILHISYGSGFLLGIAQWLLSGWRVTRRLAINLIDAKT